MSDALDEALDALAPYGAEFGGGLSNHGPMAAEALVRLGRDDAVLAWTDRYRTRLERAAGTDRRVAELGERPWRDVVREQVPPLLPGLMAAATHGVIRVAHAVRALEERDNDLRRTELASAIVYWQDSYLELPGAPPKPAGTRTPREALAAVPFVSTRLRDALITEQVAMVDAGDVGPVVDSLDPATSFDELLAAAMAAYLANERVAWIPFVHAITGPSAVRLLLPYLDADDHDAAVAYSWQAVAAIQSAYGRFPPIAVAQPAREPDWDDLADRAVANGDEHVIKLLEVCRRERLQVPDSLTA